MDHGDTLPAPPQARNKLVLVIDDDETALNLMCRRLVQRGYEVLTATGGDAGLALARAQKPDLILLDIFMPGKTGYEVLEELRSDEEIRGTPVIVMTVDDDRVRGLRLGATDYLMKPVSTDQLGKLLALYQHRLDGEVLVVDADREASDGIVRTASQLGLSARCAFDAAEGMRMIRERAPSAVVLDLSPPGMDAFRFLEAMRAAEELAAVPVIIVSGRAVSLAEHEMITSNACAYFTKGDFSPRQIAQTLKTALAA